MCCFLRDRLKLAYWRSLSKRKVTQEQDNVIEIIDSVCVISHRSWMVALWRGRWCRYGDRRPVVGVSYEGVCRKIGRRRSALISPRSCWRKTEAKTVPVTSTPTSMLRLCPRSVKFADETSAARPSTTTHLA